VTSSAVPSAAACGPEFSTAEVAALVVSVAGVDGSGDAQPAAITAVATKATITRGDNTDVIAGY
jgi:hypothetical protein